ncbi:MAG: hypothetical protein PF495_11465 [Spirochaetales bacterium]|jgi:hypothetical protein|nr:hypothetical protein [Spirochaetales bacterium]
MFSTKTGQFAWKELLVLIDGRPMLGLTDIEIKTVKNLEEIYGAGDSPQFIGEGNKSHSGNIELLQADYEALVEEAKKRGGDDVTDIEVDIIMSLIPISSDAATIAMKTIVNRIVGMKFSDDGYKFTQGNTHTKVSLPYKALRIERQI